MSQTTAWGEAEGPEPDTAMAQEWFETWHGSLPSEQLAGGYISLMGLPSKRSWSFTQTDMVGVLGDAGLAKMMWPPVAGGRKDQVEHGSWTYGADSMYAGVGILREKPEPGRRGSGRDIRVLPGVWGDWDLGGEKFASWDHIVSALAELRRVGLSPSMTVKTGGGGIHTYWHIEGGIEPEACTSMGQRLRLFVEQFAGVKLDHVEDPGRVLRIPGSVRMPKMGEGGGPVLCEFLTQEGTMLDLERAAALTQPALEAWKAETAATKARVRAARSSANRLSSDWKIQAGGGASWADMYDSANFEDSFAEGVSWAQILTAKGWTRHGEPDPQGRQEWTRPGGDERNPRSAVTDWQGSPHVMSLLSRAPETRLVELFDAKIPLTKAVVAAELWFGGDMARLFAHWKQGRGKTS